MAELKEAAGDHTKVEELPPVTKTSSIPIFDIILSEVPVNLSLTAVKPLPV